MATFDPKTYQAPFGRYEGTEPVEAPANEVLVGRARERKQLLDLFFTHARRGAYLITGHRGTGKTSFVNHCVAEYRAQVHERFLRSNVGRAWFWDRLGMFLLTAVVVVALLIVSDLLGFLVRLEKTRGPHPWLRWVISTPLVLVCLYPALMGFVQFDVWRHIRRAFATGHEPLWIARRIERPWILVFVVFGVGSLVKLTHLENTQLPPWDTVSRIIRGLTTELPASAESTIAGCTLVSVAVATFLLALLDFFGNDRIRIGIATPFSWSASAAILLMCFGIPTFVATKENHSGPLATVLPGAITAFAAGLLLKVAKSVRNDATGKSSNWHWRWAHLVVLALPALGVGYDWMTSKHFAWRHTVLPALLVVALVVTIARLLFRNNEGPKPVELIQSMVISGLRGMALMAFGVLLVLRATRHAPTTITEEAHFLTLILLIVAIFGYLEHEWILVPYTRLSRNPQPANDGERFAFYRMASHTFAWTIHSMWLPVLPISVNLGVEKLHHRIVIEAMLTGLRDAYDRAFVHWRSARANIGRIFKFLLLVFGASLAGDYLFALDWKLESRIHNTDFCANERAYLRPGMETLCRINPSGQAATLIQLVLVGRTVEASVDAVWDPLEPSPYLRDLGIQIYETSPATRQTIADYALPTSPRPQAGNAELAHEPCIHVYHILLLFLFYAAARAIEQRWPLLPYSATLREIQNVLDGLSSQLSEESREVQPSGSMPIEIAFKLFGRDRTLKKQTEPLDPRTVEFAFLRILRDIDHASYQLPFLRIAVPVPELVFILDELDKITGTDRRLTTDAATVHSREPWNEERERSRALHALFADLKNILSSAPARFVFIGGRNLHDEWLADQTARQPLLTRMFHAEIYLPSLLADQSLTQPQPEQDWDPEAGPKAYLVAQKRRANALHNAWQRKRYAPWLGIWYEERLPSAFVADDTALLRKWKEESARWFVAKPLAKWGEIRDDEGASPQTAEQLAKFLTYRSKGNVKQLKELVERFLQLQNTNESLAKDDEHALILGDTELHRIQLIADIYRRLNRTFQGRPFLADDKLAPAILYLSDFLLKFHRRAFSRSNLERVDELVHIHRTPDLRGVLEDIVRGWTGTILHPILNGLYDYRFDAGIAQELRIASRASEEELAALNFTLDESQSLKEEYVSRLRAAKGTASYEIEAALGELHEFDEEYERARYYYRGALRALDDKLAADLQLPPGTSALFDVLSGKPLGKAILQLRPIWCVARVRLLMQVAMTYERTKDLETAFIEYKNARTLAREAIAAMSERTDDGVVSALKHLRVLFQPVMAEAWVAEKIVAGVDTGPALLEEELAWMRSVLPFVRESYGNREPDKSPSKFRHANFALTLAELHDKAGDLYFIKGRARTTTDGTQGMAYLRRAQVHYATALHEVRSFNRYRKINVKEKLGLRGAKPGIWSDFVAQVAAGALSDLADTLLAQMTEAWQAPMQFPSSADCELGITKAAEIVIRWLDGTDERPNDAAWKGALKTCFGSKTEYLALGYWLCETPNDSQSSVALPSRQRLDNATNKLAAYLVLSMVSAEILQRDGHFEDAAREALQVAETTAQFVWAGQAWRTMHDTKHELNTFAGSLCQFGALAIARATKWWKRAAKINESKKLELGNTVPVEAHTITCSLALATLQAGGTTSELVNVAEAWSRAPVNATQSGWRMTLILALERHRYPMSNRIMALKVLADDESLDTRASKHQDTNGHVNSFIEYEQRHRSPLHFTPFELGCTLALANRTEAAIEALERSLQMISMQPAYYEAIADMYYLYDDFNDRRIHYKHAIQMACADLTQSLLNKMLEQDNGMPQKQPSTLPASYVTQPTTPDPIEQVPTSTSPLPSPRPSQPPPPSL